MTPAALVRAFERFKATSGIVGVAFGPKEVAGKTCNNPLSVSFFVKKKLARKGARRTLADGRRRLPKLIEFQGEKVATDVVVVGGHAEGDVADPAPEVQVNHAGGRVSNLQLTGTIGCLVRRRDGSGLSLLTNRHIALDPGTVLAIPDFQSSDAVAGTTSKSVGFVADETFLPVFDQPQSYIDVDCALVDIAQAIQDRFSPDIPNLGVPSGMFQPAMSSTKAYVNSLMGLEVSSFSWKSGLRTGTISHVYYVYQQSSTGMQRVANFTVKSSDGNTPGLPGDSGKLWLTQTAGQNLCVGIHSGVVADDPQSSRFAIATEFASLARFMNFDLA
ncbi:hypothetical protein [Bradyrhizobium sp. OK095]|uniref:hypothetical protein n=1 Tax=Bradyrhizobium sp. OK095 TaxID=1882760 RepID=UPI0008ADC825|nr:hypothetical protein [Bradyrhizobium sp. OK095]SEN58048.1 hypothetical protein SAMN05443254_109219 [Bradyrhizobium sp. OK095]